MIAKTSAQRQAELKQRRKDAGLSPVTNLWAHPDDIASIREHAAKLQRKRERAEKASNDPPATRMKPRP